MWANLWVHWRFLAALLGDSLGGVFEVLSSNLSYLGFNGEKEGKMREKKKVSGYVVIKKPKRRKRGEKVFVGGFKSSFGIHWGSIGGFSGGSMWVQEGFIGRFIGVTQGLVGLSLRGLTTGRIGAKQWAYWGKMKEIFQQSGKMGGEK